MLITTERPALLQPPPHPLAPGAWDPAAKAARKMNEEEEEEVVESEKGKEEGRV